MSSVRESTIKSVKWAGIEKVSVQGVQFLLGLLMARLLTPDDYGTVGMLSIFIAISSTFIDSGFTNALIRKKDRNEDDFCTAFYFNFFIAVVCYLVLFAIAPWVGRFFNIPVLCPILRIQSVTLLLNSLIGVQVAKLTAELNFKILAKRSLLASILSGLFGLLLAYLGFGVWALVGQNLAFCLTNVIFVCTYCRWIPRRRFSVSSFHSLFSYGSRLLAAGLLNRIYDNLTPLVIGKFYTSKDLGFYSRGSHLAHYPVSMINDVLAKVTFPILAEIQDDDKKLIQVYRKYICLSSMLIFFGCVLLAALARPLVLFLLTSKWESCIIFLQLFCFATMFEHISRINLNLLQVKGRSDLFLRLEILKKTISTAILFASIPFGVIGICVSKLIYTQIAIFINTYYTGRLFNLGYLAQVKDFIGFFVFSLLACLPSFILTYLGWNNLLTLIVGAIISTTLYILLLRKNQYFREVIHIVTDTLLHRNPRAVE